MRFPASDIPSQARQLYLKNWLCVIANVDYQPSALVPVLNPLTGTALDMSHCALRSVSPLHIEYMKNMGVAATMTISLITRADLWGLLVCHHQTPRYLSHTTRYACELLGQILSSFISGKEEYDHFMYEWKIRTIQGSLLGNLPKEEHLVEGLVKSGTHGILARACAARMQRVGCMVNESRRPSGKQEDAWFTRSQSIARSRLSMRSLNGRSST